MWVFFLFQIQLDSQDELDKHICLSRFQSSLTRYKIQSHHRNVLRVFLLLQAVEELFNLMQLFVAQRADMREEELEDIKQFKKTTISCYLRCLDGRSCWTTLIRSARRHEDNTD